MKIEKIGLYYNRKDVVAVKSIIELPGNFLADIDSAFNLKHYIGKQMEIFVGNLPLILLSGKLSILSQNMARYLLSRCSRISKPADFAA